MTLIQRIISGPVGPPKVTITDEPCRVCRGTGTMTVVVEKGFDEKIACPHCRGTGKTLD